MPKNTKVSRSDFEEKEYYRGLVRKRDKRIKLLEREVSRLTKYLMRDDLDYEWDEEESKIKAPTKEPSWICAKCQSTDYDELTLPQRNYIRRYVTCKGCGNRTRIDVNGEFMAT